MKLKVFVFISFLISIIYSCQTTSDYPENPQGHITPVVNGQSYWVEVPGGDSFLFWNSWMTPERAYDYRGRGGITYCNVFLGDSIVDNWGEQVYRDIFPNGIGSPNNVFWEWTENSNLVWLHPSEYTTMDIQQMADKGMVILLAYYNAYGYGHLAFVGNSNLTLYTYPALPDLEGKKGYEMGESWAPVVVQAGTYTGITQTPYATNGWFNGGPNPFEQGILRFYLVKDNR